MRDGEPATYLNVLCDIANKLDRIGDELGLLREIVEGDDRLRAQLQSALEDVRAERSRREQEVKP